MSDSVIELIKLDNGDIALRHSDAPDNHLLTIAFSDQVQEFLQFDQMEVARAMVEAGMNSYRNIQLQRVKELSEAASSGMLH